jgi:hypothetical protein
MQIFTRVARAEILKILNNFGGIFFLIHAANYSYELNQRGNCNKFYFTFEFED